MASSSYFPSCSSFTQRTYDVFLSFRGEDTRKSFTDHLYSALDSQGIYTFRDDEELERGQPISSNLLEAIRESSIALVVLSINYASSTWCLEELAAIVECMENMGQTVFSIFYYVDPSYVRKQTGKFGEAFDAHEKRFKDELGKEKVNKWRYALNQVSNLSGFPLLGDKHETKFIQEIMESIISVLNRTLPLHSNDLKLAGVELPLKEIMKLCSATSKGNDVVLIGICGMGGIGKTTLAQALYNKVTVEFRDKCFLKNVREISKRDGIDALKKELLFNIFKRMDVHYGEISRRLRRKKVLIVIDDVDNLEQLEPLAGSKDWFGHGSRIIITTRNEQLLIAHHVDRRYKVKKLSNDHALELFSWRVFRNNHPPKDYMELSYNILDYAKGLPLAINVLGASLCGNSILEWKDAFSRMQQNLDQNVMSKLRISFDGLPEKEKQIFLDIACFFKGRDRDEVTLILQGFGFHPIIGIRALIRKSLITIVENKLWMHDLLQEMGWELVREECRSEPGNRSRLWQSADVLDMMKYNKGSGAVQGIVLDLPQGQKEQLRCDALSNLTKLRYLNFSNVLLPQAGLNYLSTELQVLEWHGYPLNLLPKSCPSEKLVQLDMCGSHIKYLWKGCRHLDKLKSIDLEFSESLIETPDFTGVPNLERLILEGCINLSKVHSSISSLKRLVLLNMKNCKRLEFLPDFISLESLKLFNLSNCVRLKRFPEIVGDMEFLFKLYLGGTAVEELPVSIGCLTGLTLLDLADCKNLLRLPDVFSSLSRLKTINLAGCSNLGGIPENIQNAVCLENLDISGTATRQMPSSIVTSFLKHCIPTVRPGLGLLLPPYTFSSFCCLRKLDLRYCNLFDGAIPNYFDYFSSLRVLKLCGNPFTRLPESINRMSKLEGLFVEDCSRLLSLPKLPSNMKGVWAKGCVSLHNDSDQYDLCDSADKGHVFIDKRTSTGICPIDILNSQFVTLLKRYHEVPISQPMRTAYGLLPKMFEIPKWLNNSSSSSSVTIPLTRDDKSKTWMGYALLVIMKFDEDLDRTSGFKVKHEFHTMEDLHYNGTLYHEINVKVDVLLSSGSHGYWIIMPSQWLSTKLNIALNDYSSIESHTSISDCPHVVVECSGARLLYDEHDFEDFVRAMLCNTRHLKLLNKSSSVNLSPMVVVDGKLDLTIPFEEHLRWLSSDLECFELENIKGRKYYRIEGYITDSETASVFGKILQEYSGQYNLNYRSSFPQCEIPEWFCSASGFWGTILPNPSSEWLCLSIPLNPELEWKGIAICASFTVQGNSSLVLDSLDLNYPHTQCLWGAQHRYTSVYKYIDKVVIDSKCFGFICIFYLSRMHISLRLGPEFSRLLPLNFQVRSKVKDIRVQSVGLQVVFQENMDELMETILQCSTRPQFQLSQIDSTMGRVPAIGESSTHRQLQLLDSARSANSSVGAT